MLFHYSDKFDNYHTKLHQEQHNCFPKHLLRSSTKSSSFCTIWLVSTWLHNNHIIFTLHKGDVSIRCEFTSTTQQTSFSSSLYHLLLFRSYKTQVFGNLHHIRWLLQGYSLFNLDIDELLIIYITLTWFPISSTSAGFLYPSFQSWRNTKVIHKTYICFINT